MSQDKDRLLQTEPIVELHLDAGVFVWLNEMVTAKHDQRTYRDWLPWYDSLVERAYEQFKTADPARPEPEKLTTRRVRMRRSAPVSTPPKVTGKRVIRRRG